MKRIFIFVLMICSMSVFGQYKEVKLWEKDIPYSSGKFTDEKSFDDGARIENIQIPVIQIFEPKKEVATKSAVIICPGGGYKYVSIQKEGYDVAKWLSDQGITAIVLKYRLPISENLTEKTPVPGTDISRAIRLVRSKAKELGIDTAKIGVLGFSAGGHLAATAATHFDEGKADTSDVVERQSSRPDFSVLVYPVITMSEFTHKGSKDRLLGENPTQEMIDLYSNELQVRENTPPAFLVHASDDGAVPAENSLMFFNNMLQYKVPGELHVFEKGGHGFGLNKAKGTALAWPERCIDWFKQMQLLEK